MSTAHRPTYQPAKGDADNFKTAAVSSKDQPSHLTLKERKKGQNSKQELNERDLKFELEKKEQEHFIKKNDNQEQPTEQLKIESNKPQEQTQNDKLQLQPPSDDEIESEDEIESDSDEDINFSDSDDDDEEEELRRELEQIKKAREEQRAKEEEKARENEEKQKQEEILQGNPLLSKKAFEVKRRWDDDVVFKNQARDERKVQKRFINDTIRNDFHRKFLDRYIQ
eukprot:gb/GECH01013685.1/.p1 GENE.gb/GECH01013685.1/~~gb/GECH01013685.1/.p1  ORF type:complete len:225 (+),score=100.13 gb/GECH01013685.1/:1-675(+)